MRERREEEKESIPNGLILEALADLGLCIAIEQVHAVSCSDASLEKLGMQRRWMKFERGDAIFWVTEKLAEDE